MRSIYSGSAWPFAPAMDLRKRWRIAAGSSAMRLHKKTGTAYSISWIRDEIMGRRGSATTNEGAMRRAALITLLAVASSGAAAQWVEVGSNDNTTIYADPATIRKAGDLVKMWHLIDYTKARGIDGLKPYMSARALDEYDCKLARTRMLSIAVHSGNMGEGEVLGTSTDPGKWQPVLPDSLVETLWAFACGDG